MNAISVKIRLIKVGMYKIWLVCWISLPEPDITNLVEGTSGMWREKQAPLQACGGLFLQIRNSISDSLISY